MVDIYRKPTKNEVEDLREQLGDPFLWYMTRNVIRNLNENKIDFSCEANWKCLTRMMFKNYSAVEVFGMVEKCLEEASDEQYDWFYKKYPNGIKFEEKEFKFDKSKYNPNSKYGQTKDFINKNVKITDVAKYYGLKMKNNMAICPFHEDKSPSLSFSDEKNIFHCFGCNISGDIIKFVQLMENIKLKEENNDGSK